MGGARTDCGVRWARRAGFVLGLAAVAACVLAWRVPPGAGRLGGADVIFSAGPTGELDLRPAGPVLSVRELSPSSGVVRGSAEVTNRTGRRLVVRVRALPDSRALDRSVQVELRGGASPFFRGPLGTLRRWTRRGFVLRPGETGRLEVRAWIPGAAPGSYQGAIASVPLELAARAAGVRP
jgi:hypothetical protein